MADPLLLSVLSAFRCFPAGMDTEAIRTDDGRTAVRKKSGIRLHSALSEKPCLLPSRQERAGFRRIGLT